MSARTDTMSENDLLGTVVDMCRTYGLLVHHSRPALNRDGRWITPITGDAGLPDCIIVGPAGVLWRELKDQRGQPTPGQRKWIALLTRAGQNVALWRPSDLDSGRILAEIKEVSGR